MYNPNTKREDYINSMKVVDEMAIKAGVKPEVMALQLVKENIPLIQRYVTEHGERPEENPIALAAQATLIHESKIWDKIENEGIPDYEAAEKQVLAEDQALEDRGGVSNFGGGILGIVFKAGSKGLDKINEKRVKAGKKPLLAGDKGVKLRNKVLQHIELEEVQGRGIKPAGDKWKKTDAGILLDSLAREVENEKTKEALMKYLPFIIIAAVIIYLIGKKSA